MSTTSPPQKLNRQTQTPFLLNLCYRLNGHHRLDEFPLPPTHTLPRDRIQIYTWPTCTLRELSQLLTSALPSLLPNPVIGTRISYRLVYPDAKDAYLQASAGRGGANGINAGGPMPRYLSKELGSVVVGAASESEGEEEGGKGSGEGLLGEGKLEGEPEKTLADARFVIGDFVSCAIYPPGRDGEVAPPPPPPTGPGMGVGRGRGRENGFRGGGGGGGEVFRGRGPRGGGFERGGQSYGRLNDGGIPSGEWRRGERLPDGGREYGRGGYGRGRGRGW